MRRALVGVFLVVVAVIVGAAAFLWLKQPAQRPPSTEQFESTPERLARGGYLFEHLLDCGGCHSERDPRRWGMPVVLGRSGAGGWCEGPSAHYPGRICMPNISSDPETGLGSWSDGEIARAVREGVSRDGRALFPMMPWMGYRNLSEEDTRSLVVFLRTLPPVRNPVPRTKLDFPLSVIVKFMPRPLTGEVPPPAADGAARGKYLVEIAGCDFCHTPVDDHGAPIAGRELAGGQEFVGPWGTVRSTNISADATGIGSWSREQFVSVFRSFQDVEAVAQPIDPAKNTVMPWLAYAGITEEDLGLIYDHLRSLPPQNNVVDRRPRPGSTSTASPAAP